MDITAFIKQLAMSRPDDQVMLFCVIMECTIDSHSDVLVVDKILDGPIPYPHSRTGFIACYESEYVHERSDRGRSEATDDAATDRPKGGEESGGGKIAKIIKEGKYQCMIRRNPVFVKMIGDKLVITYIYRPEEPCQLPHRRKRRTLCSLLPPLPVSASLSPSVASVRLPTESVTMPLPLEQELARE